MKKKDSVEPDVKRRRKGQKVSDSTSPNVAEANSSPPTKSVRSTDGTQQPQMKRTQRNVASKGDTSKNPSLMEVSFMELESNQAQKSESAEYVDQYKDTCQEIAKLVTDIDHLKADKDKYDNKAISEKRIKSTLLTLSLKKLNRLAIIRSKTAREKTQEMKQKVDILHLDLQNLLYEVMHMKKEIQKCTEFTSKDEEIDLIDVESFYKEAPTEISKPEVTMNDNHSQMLARLEWELDQRKKLAAMKNQLLKDKFCMEKEISKQTEALTSLHPSLAGILKATVPLQEQLGLNINERKAQHETAAFLPKPLYVLFVHANAHVEGGDKNLSVTIEGDEQAAKAFLERDALKLDDYEDSEPEEGNDVGDKEENKRRKHKEEKERARLEEQRKSILRKHPLEIHVKMNCKGPIVLHLTFAYLTSMNIVTVSTSMEFSKESSLLSQSSSLLLSPDSILNRLFGEEDDGEDSPNLSNQIKLEKLGLKDFSSYVGELGRPYCWAQRISGLSYLPQNPQNTIVTDDIRRSQNFTSVIKAIRGRIASRLALQSQLIDLESLSLPVSHCVTRLFPSTIQANLEDWRCITYSDYMEYFMSKNSTQVINENALFYSLRLKRDKEELQAAVSISVNYPWQPPLFVLKENQSIHLKYFVKEVERELNVNFMELMEVGNPDMILTNQLLKLMVCFDVYCETGDLGFKQERLYLRKQRGRDRSRPYQYIKEKGLFVHNNYL